MSLLSWHPGTPPPSPLCRATMSLILIPTPAAGPHLLIFAWTKGCFGRVFQPPTLLTSVTLCCPHQPVIAVKIQNSDSNSFDTLDRMPSHEGAQTHAAESYRQLANGISSFTSKLIVQTSIFNALLNTEIWLGWFCEHIFAIVYDMCNSHLQCTPWSGEVRPGYKLTFCSGCVTWYFLKTRQFCLNRKFDIDIPWQCNS